MELILERLRGLPGVTLGVEPDPNGNPFSRPRVAIEVEACGMTAEAICDALRAGDPSIHPRGHHAEEGYFTLDQMECTDAEIEVICSRLREIVLNKAQKKRRRRAGSKPKAKKKE
jgi:seryl-tRNA(Sec) selenium transferase